MDALRDNLCQLQVSVGGEQCALLPTVLYTRSNLNAHSTSHHILYCPDFYRSLNRTVLLLFLLKHLAVHQDCQRDYSQKLTMQTWHRYRRVQ